MSLDVTGIPGQGWAKTVVCPTLAPNQTYNGATTAIAIVAQFPLNVGLYNATHAINDGFGYYEYLDAGSTYELGLMFGSATVCGVVTTDISFNAGATFTTLATTDCYNASTSGKFVTVTGITPPSSGVAILRFRVLSKNASSTDYYFYPICYTLMRTS